MKRLLSIIFKLAVTAALVYFLFFKLEVRVYRALGTSMDNTISNAELVLTIKDKNLYRGDIVIFNNEGSPAIKRIIGLPQEKIDIKVEGKIYINDKVYNESYVSTKTPQGEINYPHTVADNSYFVIGDNRLDSYDSRYNKVGDIDSSRIRGRVIFSISRFKIINRVNY